MKEQAPAVFCVRESVIMVQVPAVHPATALVRSFPRGPSASLIVLSEQCTRLRHAVALTAVVATGLLRAQRRTVCGGGAKHFDACRDGELNVCACGVAVRIPGAGAPSQTALHAESQ